MEWTEIHYRVSGNDLPLTDDDVMLNNVPRVVKKTSITPKDNRGHRAQSFYQRSVYVLDSRSRTKNEGVAGNGKAIAVRGADIDEGGQIELGNISYV